MPRITVPSCCKVCDGALTIGGPIWNQPIHDASFAKRLLKVVRAQQEVKLKTSKRIQAILTGIIDEEPLEHIPLNIDLDFLCSSIKCVNPGKSEFIYAMNQLGYKARQTYYSPKLWKTDAPPEVIYDIVKSYKHKMYKGDKTQILANLKEGTPGYRIIEKPLSI